MTINTDELKLALELHETGYDINIRRMFMEQHEGRCPVDVMEQAAKRYLEIAPALEEMGRIVRAHTDFQNAKHTYEDKRLDEQATLELLLDEIQTVLGVLNGK